MNRPTAIIFGVFGFICGIVLAGYAKSDPIPTAEPIPQAQVQSVVNDVIAFLDKQPKRDFPLPSPLVFDAYETRLTGYAGLTIEGIVVINSNRPPDCFRIDLGHEAVHVLLWWRLGLTKAKSEEWARLWDREMTKSPYRPNCGEPL